MWAVRSSDTRSKIRDHFRRLRDLPAAEGGTHAQQRFAKLPECLPPSSASRHSSHGKYTERKHVVIIDHIDNAHLYHALNLFQGMRYVQLYELDPQRRRSFIKGWMLRLSRFSEMLPHGK